jgi:hypothetical protein
MTAMNRAEFAAARGPSTPTGRYLRAVAVNDRAEGLAGEPVPDVLARSFLAAVRLRFRPDAPLLAIAASVATAARRYPYLHLPPREAEMLIRDALGEQVPTAGITPDQVMVVHMLIFSALVDELALTDDELDELIAEAERSV